ncbi:hypothetical protein J6590_015084 [Homalodisca vitripennis]|nr:hypothetical protein J6590_015084 [Homalodisca vitripennis]
MFSSVTMVQPLTCYDMCEHSTTSSYSNYSKLCAAALCLSVSCRMSAVMSNVIIDAVQMSRRAAPLRARSGSSSHRRA